jgi:hypothetical protein
VWLCGDEGLQRRRTRDHPASTWSRQRALVKCRVEARSHRSWVPAFAAVYILHVVAVRDAVEHMSSGDAAETWRDEGWGRVDRETTPWNLPKPHQVHGFDRLQAAARAHNLNASSSLSGTHCIFSGIAFGPATCPASPSWTQNHSACCQLDWSYHGIGPPSHIFIPYMPMSRF